LRGLGYVLSWPGVAVTAYPQLDAELGPDDPRRALLAERIRQSENVQNQILAPAAGAVEIEAPVLVALGNDLSRSPLAAGKLLRGKPTIACPVFEDVESVERNVAKLLDYGAVVVASRWNQDVLQGLGVEAILCHEGIDPLIFNPSVRRRRDDGRFRVFSGGKAEWRKGQDIVIEAFRVFAEKHDDAVLVAAWGSPFSQSAADFEGKWEFGAPPGLHIGMPNYMAWAQRAGIKPHQIELVGVRPNWQIAEVYGGCDVAVFPNRREGGTNFVAMECIACGLPTLMSTQYGHADVWEYGLYPIRSTERAACVGELAELLDVVYDQGADRPVPPSFEAYWAWERHCRQMAEIVRGV
jgi:glycosyltransferase involved in cell wall biosynthesis